MAYSPLQLEADSTLALMTDLSAKQARSAQIAAVRRLEWIALSKEQPARLRVQALAVLAKVREKVLEEFAVTF